jgi:hypothetical protein
VDVVTTSEVSVSVTIDDARVPEIMAALADVADDAKTVWRSSAASATVEGRAGVCRSVAQTLDGVPVRMLSQAAAPQHHAG